jgi:hypothetical protein
MKAVASADAKPRTKAETSPTNLPELSPSNYNATQILLMHRKAT